MVCLKTHNKFQRGIFNENIHFQQFLIGHYAALPTKYVWRDLFTMGKFCYQSKRVSLNFKVKIKWQIVTKLNKENFSSHALQFQKANWSFHNIVKPTQMANLNRTLNLQSGHVICLINNMPRCLKFISIQLSLVKVSFLRGPCQKVNRILGIEVNRSRIMLAFLPPGPPHPLTKFIQFKY